MMLKRATQVTLEGRGMLTLKPADHVATGGEGSIYRAGGTVIKLYTDTDKMVRDGMADKIRLLAKITHPYVVGPQGLVLDGHGVPIGFFMPWAEGEPLSRIFTNDFRQRSGFGDPEAITLVDRMRDTVKVAHDHSATMVDANELNWIAQLAGKSGPEPRILDVDSWVIGKRPPQVAIMPSIRDWRCKALYSREADWFAWGIVTFQVFTGIHPYKGMIDGYKPAELERRMKDEVSVFTPGIRLNRAVRDFNSIPSALRNWYEATFQKGERTAPPSPYDKAISAAPAARVVRTIVTATGSLSYNKLRSVANDPALRVFPCGVVLHKSGDLFDLASSRSIGRATAVECEIIRIENGWLKADIDANAQRVFSFINATSHVEEALSFNQRGHGLLRNGNRLFLVTDQGLSELQLMRIGDRPILAISQTWGVMINSTRWYDGVGIQNLFGSTILVIPFGDKSVGQIQVKELDQLRPVSAKTGNRYVAIIAVDKQGQYQRVELIFGKDYKTYQAMTEPFQSPDLNLAALPKGVTARIVNDGELEIFVPTSGALRTIADKAIATDMILGNWENTVVYIQNGDIWSVRVNP